MAVRALFLGHAWVVEVTDAHWEQLTDLAQTSNRRHSEVLEEILSKNLQNVTMKSAAPQSLASNESGGAADTKPRPHGPLVVANDAKLVPGTRAELRRLGMRFQELTGEPPMGAAIRSEAEASEWVSRLRSATFDLERKVAK